MKSKRLKKLDYFFNLLTILAYKKIEQLTGHAIERPAGCIIIIHKQFVIGM